MNFNMFCQFVYCVHCVEFDEHQLAPDLDLQSTIVLYSRDRCTVQGGGLIEGWFRCRMEQEGPENRQRNAAHEFSECFPTPHTELRQVSQRSGAAAFDVCAGSRGCGFRDPVHPFTCSMRVGGSRPTSGGRIAQSQASDAPRCACFRCPPKPSLATMEPHQSGTGLLFFLMLHRSEVDSTHPTNIPADVKEFLFG